MTKVCTKRQNDWLIKHGCSNHRLFPTWKSIKRRCTSPKHEAYHNYGGRGITMCEEWLNSPKSFIDWCIENGWREGLQIDRIDNNSGYYPENCRFVTPKENLRNTRINIRVKYDGSHYVLKDLCEIKNIDYHLVWDRINRNGWTLEDAINKPKKKWQRNAA
jgi:hypothetical protein